jgi:hypothetical protein
VFLPVPAAPCGEAAVQQPSSGFLDFDADFSNAQPSSAFSSPATDFGAFTAAPSSSSSSTADPFNPSGFDFMNHATPAPAPAPFDPFGAAPPLKPSTANGQAASSGFDFMQAAPAPKTGGLDPFTALGAVPVSAKPSPSSTGAFDFGPLPGVPQQAPPQPPQQAFGFQNPASKPLDSQI